MCNRKSKGVTMPLFLAIEGETYNVLDMFRWPDWCELAQQKGFELFARVKDKDHLALKCKECGELNLVKVFNLRTAQPNCHPCLKSRWSAAAQKAGATMIRRCPEDPHYLWLWLPCGHEAYRQNSAVGRVARGENKFHCKICLLETEVNEAKERGWKRLGDDPNGDPNYRLYGHPCGHRQRIARGNMQTGRFTCEGCAVSSSAAPSALYLLRITLPDASILLKLGMSYDPQSRMRHQLARHRDVQFELLDSFDMATGAAANRWENRIHKFLKVRYPQHVVPSSTFEAFLTVKSEIYAPELEQRLCKLFKKVHARRGSM